MFQTWGVNQNNEGTTFSTNTKRLCACGCGQRVNFTTSKRHLDLKSTTDARVRIVEQMDMLTTSFPLYQHQALQDQARQRARVPPRRRQANAGASSMPEMSPMEGLSESVIENTSHPSHQGWVNPVANRLQRMYNLQSGSSDALALHLHNDDDDDDGIDTEQRLALPGELQLTIAADNSYGTAVADLDAGAEEDGEASGSDSDSEQADLDLGRANKDLDAAIADVVMREIFERDAAKALFLDNHDLHLLRIYALKVESHLTERIYNKLFKVFPNSGQLTLKRAKKHITSLAGFAPVRYDCCVNSCICYTGPYASLTQCPFCSELRYSTANGRARKGFDYLPIIPRLKALVRNPTISQQMLHRSQHIHDSLLIQDVYDGDHYRSLLTQTIPDSIPPTQYFSDCRDVALGLSTDGFSPFNRRDKTCWPILLFNYNLPPETRFKKGNCINIGTIPGPSKPKDWDSFCFGLIEELVKLELGIEAFDGLRQELFLLRAFLILVFGDIPAVSLMMRMKGQNGLHPCRWCNICAVSEPGKNTHYVPLSRSRLKDANNRPLQPLFYNPSDLPYRTHSEFIQQAKEVQLALTQEASNSLAKAYGIKGVPRLSVISSLSFPHSFPYDFMHLIWENTLKNLIQLWTGVFKEGSISHEGEGYHIQPHIWTTIGVETLAAGKTIPSAFGAMVPDLSKTGVILTAEMYSNWALFIAPIVLQGRFPQSQKYYPHFLEFIRLLKLCLAIDMSTDDLHNVETGFQKWVQEYERIYYMYKPARLGCCPLTIHALLHIADGIRMCGPVWAYWAFPMERHCNTLLPAIKSRRFPYVSIANFVTAVAQLDEIRLVYNINDALDLDPPSTEIGLIIPHVDYQNFKLTGPMGPNNLNDFRRSDINTEPDIDIRARIQIHLATRFQASISDIRSIFPLTNPILQFGRIVMVDTDEVIRAHDFLKRQEDTRDNTYIRYDMDIDTNTNRSNLPENMVTRSFYGQLLRVIVIDLPSAPNLNITNASTVAVALVRESRLEPESPDMAIRYRYNRGIEVIDLSTVQCVVGRVRRDGLWTYVDRTVCVGSLLN